MAFIWRAIRSAGGIRNAFWTLLRIREVKVGTLIGTDKAGNKYYENKQFFFGRHRWVYPAKRDFEGSEIPPEWHGWMHYITDKSPVEEPPVERKFIVDHQPNLSGTAKEYVPYSTTRPKVESWVPPSVKS